MTAVRPHLTPVVVAASVAVLAAGSTVGLAAVTGGFPGAAPRPAERQWASTGCTVAPLPGTVVDVALVDSGMHGMSARPGDGPRGWGPMPEGGWMLGGPMMGLRLSRSSVPAGTVSLRASDLGARVHELVVLPLTGALGDGRRQVGPDGTVPEDAALGEASRTCGEGAGDGIEPGSSGWTTLQLRPGRYELVCNLPGHYGAGMHAELDVTS